MWRVGCVTGNGLDVTLPVTSDRTWVVRPNAQTVCWADIPIDLTFWMLASFAVIGCVARPLAGRQTCFEVSS